MGNPDCISIYIAPDLSIDERESLIQIMRANGEVEESAPRVIESLDWPTFVLIMKEIGIVLGGLTAISKFAKELLEWRNRARASGVEPKAIIELQSGTQIDLSKDDDEKILAAINQEKKKE